MINRIFICEALAKRNEIDPFLKRMVTRDEKWFTYDNIVKKRSWSKRGEAAQTVAKPALTAKKAVLYIYCQRLHRLKLTIDQKRPELANRRGVVFYQDNARSDHSDSPETMGAWLDEVEKLAYQLNEEAERTERPIRRLSKVMYGSTCADMQVDVMGECLSSIKPVVGVRSVFLAKRLHAV
ncbi:mariner transposase [Trichonephila clavipes]|nr:mariner transposase [Trichonephila clavipes]